jgi:GTPase SAR1 family protein
MTSKRIEILGSFGVSKTSLIHRFVDHTLSEDYKVAIGVPTLKKAVKIKTNLFSLIIWNTKGTENAEETRKAYLLGSEGFNYETTVTRPKTPANHIKHKEYLKNPFGNVPNINIGNRGDLLPKRSLSQKKRNEIFRHAPQC